jgi:hypothetical protein
MDSALAVTVMIYTPGIALVAVIFNWVWPGPVIGFTVNVPLTPAGKPETDNDRLLLEKPFR